MAVARRPVTRLPRAQRVSDILAAARAVFSERDYEESSISEIAARAGVVEGTIYKFFAGKRDLLHKVIDDWYAGMLADYQVRLAGIEGTRNRLRFVIWSHLKSIEESPGLCRQVFNEVRGQRDYFTSSVHDHHRHYTYFALDVLREGIVAGEVRPDVSITLVRDMIYGAVEHHSLAYICGQGSLDVETAADQITDVVLAGVLVTEAESSDQRLDRIEAKLDRALAAGS
ncbi:MAG: TetR/AcrR family transcriptional regulator [Alphaproteobacteria bacterium]|nr:TetR/AcrR family transcriptional regulator [Alphaproteobacteria bacterium]HJP21052.1 TetR/AcrR family transcriptional regulator [Alphaproteobacteria bacterium]